MTIFINPNSFLIARIADQIGVTAVVIDKHNTYELRDPREARAAELEAALSDPFISEKNKINALEELAEIETSLQRDPAEVE